MLADDPAALRSCRLRGQDVFLLTQGENLAADQAGHGHPVQDAENDEKADDVAADLLQRGSRQSRSQGLLQDAGQKDDHQHVRKRIDDVHDAHDDQVDLSAAVARDGAHGHADEQDNDTGEEAHRQRDARTVDHTDKVITPSGIGAEDMRENQLPCFDLLQLRLPIGKGRQIIIGRVHGFARVHPQHLVVGIRPEHGDKDGRERDDNDDDQRYGRDAVSQQALHAVLKEGGGRPHLNHVALFFLGRGEEIVHVHMHAKFV